MRSSRIIGRTANGNLVHLHLLTLSSCAQAPHEGEQLAVCVAAGTAAGGMLGGPAAALLPRSRDRRIWHARQCICSRASPARPMFTWSGGVRGGRLTQLRRRHRLRPGEDWVDAHSAAKGHCALCTPLPCSRRGPALCGRSGSRRTTNDVPVWV